MISGWLKFVFQVDNVHPTDLFRHKIWAQGVNPSKETEQKVSGVLGNKRMRYDGFSWIYPKIAPKYIFDVIFF